MDTHAVDRTQLEAALRAAAAAAPLVIHHFATWCDPCAEELPLLKAEFDALRPLGVGFVAISWDLFMSGDPPAVAVRSCIDFLARAGIAFDQLFVFTGSPPELFESQRIEHGTVPCTEVRARGGAVVASFPHPLFEDAERAAFVAAVRSAASA